MKKRREAIGRPAVDWLKQRYLDGVQYAASGEIRDAIAAEFGGKLRKCAVSQAVAWDRQARLELADERVFVTQPVRKTGYARNPNASPDLRELTQASKVRDWQTRTENQARMASAAAAQIDATAVEIRRAERIKIAAEVLAGLDVALA